MNSILKSNINIYETVGRMLIGIALVSGVMFFSSVVPAWVSLLAIYPVITAIMAWDPIYAVLLKVRSHVEQPGRVRKAPMVS